MEQNKTRTYLLYAVGEIALVMIGILLALQVNNWNEERVNEKQRLVFLNYLESNLTEDLNQLQQIGDHLDKTINRSLVLIESYKHGEFDQKKATASIGWLNIEQTFVANKTGMDAILGAGVLDLFEPGFSFQLQQYYAMVDQLNNRQFLSNVFIREKYEPLYYKNYSQSFKLTDVYDIVNLYEDDPRKAVLVDIEALKQDYEFEAMITIRHVHSKVEKDLVEQLKVQGEMLMSKIKDQTRI